MPSKDGNGGKPAAVICIGNLLFFGGSPFRTNRGATLACNTGAVLIGASELRYTRHPDPATQTGELLASAIAQVSQEAGIAPEEIDGLGVSSFTFGPDHAVDLAFRCGMNLGWIMEDTNGGASGINLLQHAARAIESGDASTIVLVSGDRMPADDFRRLVDEYNSAARDCTAPLGLKGPNSMFALLTQRHQRRHGLDSDTYGRVAVAQRGWAELNPGAVYRSPLSLDEYRAAPEVSTPLRRYDCVPPVTGAGAVIVTSADRVGDRPGVAVRAIQGSVNHDLHRGDGLSTGHARIASGLWDRSGCSPDEMDVISVYDDYPVMVLIQLAELGFVPDGDLSAAARRLHEDRWPVNTSGGQLSAGQAGAAAGMHGLVEAVTQLQHRVGGRRQVADAAKALVSGYGMVTYRYGSCANAAVLERI